MAVSVEVKTPHKQLIWLQRTFPLLYEILTKKEKNLKHSLRATAIGFLLGKELKLFQIEVDILCKGLLVHDIGKTYWPEEIYVKADLTEQERDFIVHHPQAGFNLLMCSGFPRDMATIALQHHEKADGQGYPYKLTDADIAPLAVIAAVADSFENLTGSRPYRDNSFSYHAAINILIENGGYDPVVLQALANIVKNDFAIWS